MKAFGCGTSEDFTTAHRFVILVEELLYQRGNMSYDWQNTYPIQLDDIWEFVDRFFEGKVRN